MSTLGSSLMEPSQYRLCFPMLRACPSALTRMPQRCQVFSHKHRRNTQACCQPNFLQRQCCSQD